MKKETLENLQTLMEELQRIEEANELLREQHERCKAQIEHERQAHQETQKQLMQEKEKMEENKLAIEALKLTNETLITQLKQFKQTSQLIRSQQKRVSTIPLSSDLQRKNLNSSAPAAYATSNENLDFPSQNSYKFVRKLQPSHQGSISYFAIVGNQVSLLLLQFINFI
jgi:ATP-dependent 26S proteasome regulatory subunit